MRILAAVLVLAMGACADEVIEPGQVAVRDSSGITIVESGGPALGGASPVRVARRPDVSIGSGNAPEDVFGMVVDAARLSDGRILVIDLQRRDIRAFDPVGNFLETWSGQGEGPGEVEGPWMVEAQVGDTVVVIDRFLRRTTLFDARGEVIRTSDHTVAFTLPVNHMMSESCCVPLGVGSDGTVVWRLPDIWSTEGAGLRNTYAIAVRRGREGGQDTVGVFRSGIAAPWEGPNRVVSILFSPRWAARPDPRQGARGFTPSL